MVNEYHPAGRARGIHPNSLRALEQNRARTQFGQPDGPARCSVNNCNRFAWKKSRTGTCWHHAGRALAKVERKTPWARNTRALRRARKVAESELRSLLPDIEERAAASRLLPHLADEKDFNRLQLLIVWQSRGMIDHRAYRAMLSDLCPSKFR